jgi:hypothetical protein
MTKRLIVFLILALFLLGACSGAEQVAVSENSETNTESQPTEAVFSEDEPTEAVPTEIKPTEAAASDSGSGVSISGVQMECTLVSDQPDAPAEFVELFGVTEDDWAKGSETAAVTFVEYGDFQ